MSQALTLVPFEVVGPQSFYTVKGVMLPNGAHGDVQVTEQLLDEGRSRTQKEWVSYRNETGWGPGSGPLVTAVLTTLHYNRNAKGVEELRQIFGEDFRKRLMMTATGITYRAGAPDIVTHDSETPAERTLEARLVGPDGRVNEKMGDVTQALLGNSNALQIRDVYKWVTGRESYLWRGNKRPKQNQELALVLGGFGGDFLIDAEYDIYGSRPARGVRIAPQSSTGSKG